MAGRGGSGSGRAMERVQEHLSAEGTYLMGDAQVRGFPIRYASPGFEQTYGYGAADIVGKKCGDVIGGPTIATRSYAIAELANAAGVTLREADARLRFLTGKAAEACRVMMANPGTRVGVALLVNRKRNGQLFVCECLVLCLRHPNLEWSYTVGFQRDISKEVPLHVLLGCAASENAYSDLLDSRASALNVRRATLLGVGGENIVRCLHQQAMDVFSLDIWRTLRSDLLLTPGDAAAGEGGAPPAQPCASTRSSALALRKHEWSVSAASSATRSGPSAGASGPTSRAARHPPRVPRTPGPTAPAVPIMEQVVMAGPPSPACSAAVDLEACEEMIAFLSGMGLHSFAEPLLRVGFDSMETLMDMTDADMKDLGLPRGYAVKLKKRLNSYQGRLQICDEDRQEGALDTPSSAVAPDDADKAAVQLSWERIQELGAERFGTALFQEMFRLDRSTQRLFPAEVCEKYSDWSRPQDSATEAGERLPAAPQLFEKVANIIGGSIVGLHDAQSLVPSLVQMGVRHAAYGVGQQHLELLGQALPIALQQVLGDEFTSEVEHTWSVVFSFLAASMAGGMRAAPSLTPATPGSACSRGRARSEQSFEGRSPADRAAPTLLQGLHAEAQWGSAHKLGR